MIKNIIIVITITFSFYASSTASGEHANWKTPPPPPASPSPPPPPPPPPVSGEDFDRGWPTPTASQREQIASDRTTAEATAENHEASTEALEAGQEKANAALAEDGGGADGGDTGGGMNPGNLMMGAGIAKTLSSLAFDAEDAQKINGGIDIVSGGLLIKATCPPPTNWMMCIYGVSSVLNGANSLRQSRKSRKYADELTGGDGTGTGTTTGPNPPPTCSDGSTCPANGICPDGNSCTPVCSDGMIWNGSVCTPTEGPPTCSDGSTCPANGICPDGNSCTPVCSDDMIWNGSVCTPIEDPPVLCLDGSTCPANGICPDGNSCTPVCSDDMIWNGSVCTPIEDPPVLCLDGSTCPANGICPDGNSCTPICSDGSTCPANGICPDGTTCRRTGTTTSDDSGPLTCDEDPNQAKCEPKVQIIIDTCLELIGEPCTKVTQEACQQLSPHCQLGPNDNFLFFDPEGNSIPPGTSIDGLGKGFGMTPAEIDQGKNQIKDAQNKAVKKMGNLSKSKSGKLKKHRAFSPANEDLALSADSANENFKPSLSSGGGGASSNNRGKRRKRGANSFSRQLQSLLDKKKGHRAEVKKHGYKPTKLGNQNIGTTHDNIFDMMSRGYQTQENSLNIPER